MARLDDLDILPLFRATHDPVQIVQVAAGRAIRELLLGEPASRADAIEPPPYGLLKDPRVTAALWTPPYTAAMDLASSAPNRSQILEGFVSTPRDQATAGFLDLAHPRHDRDDPQNRVSQAEHVTKWIAREGANWVPEIDSLFRIYLALFDRATAQRLDWIGKAGGGGTNRVEVVPLTFGDLIASWELAWSASRAPRSAFVNEVVPQLASKSPKVRWAAAQFIEEAAKLQGTSRREYGGGTAPGFGSPDAAPASEASLEDKDTATKTGWFRYVVSPPIVFPPAPAAEQTLRDPEPRFANVVFARDNDGQAGAPIDDTVVLKARRWYWIEVSIKTKPGGIKTEGQKDDPVRPVHQKGPIDLLVAADSEEFEFKSQLQPITLPPTGDSTHSAFFRLRSLPLSELSSKSARIDLRFFYRFNLIEHFVVTAEIGSDEETRPIVVQSKKQQSIARDYLDLDDFLPRQMNIHVTRKDEVFHLRFVLEGDGAAAVILRARSTFTYQDLETTLEELRAILENLVDNDYRDHAEVSKFKALESIRRLAHFGHDLWLGFFRKNPGSDLDKFGLALKNRPIGSGALIQISMPDLAGAPFLFPWAILYDQSIPEKQNELPDPNGFWGYRYAIEQLLPGNQKNVDKPKQIDDLMRMAFMLWEPFKNAPEQKELMADLSTRASPGLKISDPPLTRKREFYDVATKLEDAILYFYAHGHTKRPKPASEQPALHKMVMLQMDQLPDDSPARRTLGILLKRLQREDSEPDKSFIVLSQAILYYSDILENVNAFPAEPFVFLNICESAGMIPLSGENFVSLFLELGARAVLGTECKMTINFAHPFARVFLSEVLRGEPLAQALRSSRRYFLDRNNPLGLAYTLYGSGTLKFLPPRLKSISQLENAK